MLTISVKNLKRYFKVYKRPPGFLPTFSSLFRRKMEEVKAVDNISFTIEKGELVGFIGPNGAGKTTTLKCLSGLLYPSSGEIKVLGYIPFDRKKEFLKSISLIMGQKNQLWWDLPPLDSFELNKEIYEIDDKSYKKSLDELVTLLEVRDILKVPVRQLSLGQRMKMELIAALLHKPQILFLDEPTIGLDVVMQKKIRDFIKEYNKRAESTILLTSHYMADVKELCKRIIIIDRGKIMYDGQLSDLAKKYSDIKIITIIFEKEIPKEIFKKGIVKYVEDQKIVMTIPKGEAKDFATYILKKYQIDDLNIEEPEIEEIIRLVFRGR